MRNGRNHFTNNSPRLKAVERRRESETVEDGRRFASQDAV